ncbi:MAG: D-2-hydroxyacid dehydrogenase [Pseudomonadota bacterium]
MKAVFLDYGTVDAGDLDARRLMDSVSSVTLYDFATPDTVVPRLKGAEAALVNKVRLGPAEFAALPDLRYVGLAATGADNVDLDAAAHHRITVTNIRDYCSHSVAQHVFAVLLALTRRLDAARATVSEGRWRTPQRDGARSGVPVTGIRDLQGLVIGLVGYGALARAVEATARHFGMTVLVAESHGGAAAGRERVAFDALLAQSDVLSLHCPLTAHTRNLIDRHVLRQLKPGAILINTARGGLVDSVALADALRDGHLAGAAIDVLPSEPPPADEPLLNVDLPNLILTPHVAWASQTARQRALDSVAANLLAFRSGSPVSVVSSS